MWSYYGAKTNLVDHYPKPQHDKIIEPFAGTVRYSLKYFENEITLVDSYDVIIKIWKWLQKCSEKDVLSLPRYLSPGQTLDDFTFDCEEAKMLMGFLIAKGVEKPRVKPTDWVILQRPNFTNYSLKRIASNLFKIRHWKLELGCYSSVNNEKCTWFIDPPYQHGGYHYIKNNRRINYQDLKQWVLSRAGQVIVCENMDANWMDFNPVKCQKGTKRTTMEAIWSNLPTPYDNQQLTIFKATHQ